ncbi:MAG TPA: hypothetical protein VFR15_10235 [Chloroflexia bacterium]|nr:hypothetical protein [Chloroflexia bacterium]
MEAEVAYGQAGVALPESRGNPARALPRSIAFGVLASLSLLVFYVGTIAIVQDWEHALTQLGEDAPFVAALVVGFGVQVALFTYTRALQASTSRAGVAAGAGSSSAAMLACCAHHLTDVLPVVGLSAAAGFLGAYREPLLWLSLGINAGGVIYLAGQLRTTSRALAAHDRREPACHAPQPASASRSVLIPEGAEGNDGV